MPSIAIKDEVTRERAIDVLRHLKFEHGPFVVKVDKYRKDRSQEQNRLYQGWLSEIAAHPNADRPREEYRAYTKLHFGVPIMREVDAWRDRYDKIIKPLPYEVKLELMGAPMEFPVTSAMNTEQMTRFVEAVYQEFRAQGFMIEMPVDQ